MNERHRKVFYRNGIPPRPKKDPMKATIEELRLIKSLVGMAIEEERDNVETDMERFELLCRIDCKMSAHIFKKEGS